MKKVFKFTLAALAATVLASCSTDDFSDFGGEKGQLKKGNLIVEVEGMKDPVITRSMIVPTEKTGTLYWQKKDRILVYDESVQVYDIYEFQGDEDGFELYGKKNSNLADVKYAAFGVDENPQNTWNWKDNKTTLNMNIPNTLTWGEETVGTGKDRETAYLSQLPMWGTAERIEGDKVKASLRYLTGILRVDLKNLRGNAKFLYVRGWQGATSKVAARMTGDFGAVIRSDEYVTEENPTGINKDAALDPESTTLSNEKDNGIYVDNNWIKVNVEGATEDNSTVFIPIIAQEYTKLELAASMTEAFDAGQVDAIFNGNNTLKWSTSKPVTVVRGAYYNVSKTFNIAGTTVNELNDALEEAAGEGGDVEITATNVTKAGKGDGEKIILPYKDDVKKYVLNLKGLEGTDVVGEILKIEAPMNRHESIDIVLNMYGTKADTRGISKIYINAPNANVIVKGLGLEEITVGDMYYVNAGTGEGINANRFAPYSMNVASLTIGAEAKTHNGNDCKNHTGTAVTAKCNYSANVTTKVANVYVNANETLENVTVEEGALVIGNLQLEQTTKAKTIVVEGQVNGLVDATIEETKNTESNFIEVTLGTRSAHIGTLKTNQPDFAVEGTSTVDYATCAGNVTVASKNATVIETLTMKTYYSSTNTGAKRTLTLTGGYIRNLVTAKRGNSYNDEILLVNEETIPGVATAFGYVTRPNVKYVGASKWGGTAISDSYYRNKHDIVTASQLQHLDPANVDNTKQYELLCDIDVSVKAIAPLSDLWTSFKGNNHKIIGLKVNGADNMPAGLFGTVHGKASTMALNNDNFGVISDLTIEGATITGKGNAGTGVLFGKAVRRLTVKNVTVSGTVTAGNTTVSGVAQKDEENVGGLGGLIAKSTDGNDTLVVEGVTVNCSTIKGRYNLGGLVGTAENVKGKGVTITTAGFSVLLPGYMIPTSVSMQTDKKYGSVGKYCGNLEKTLELTESTHGADMTLAERVKYGFMLDYMEDWHWNGTANDQTGYVFPDDGNNYYYYGSTGGVVGKIKDGNVVVKIGGKTFVNHKNWLRSVEPKDATAAADLYAIGEYLRSNKYLEDEDVEKLF